MCLLATAMPETAAQNLHDEITENEVSPLIPEEDAAEQNRLLDWLWETQPALQANWGWRSDGVRPSHLGGHHYWQIRMNAGSGPWQTGFIVDKDLGEPWGAGNLPWTGPELKRWSLEREGQRFTLRAGSFRIQHGYGLISGRRTSAMPARSNPLRLPRKVATSTGYAGSGSGAVRSGILAGLEGKRGAVRVWHSAHAATASTSTVSAVADSSVTQIRDLSGTSIYSTKSSIARRNLVNLTSSGLQLAVAGPSWQLALMSEHLRTNINGTMGQRAHSLLPASLTAASLTARASVGRMDIATEHAIMERGGPSRRSSVRWRHPSGSGIMIDHAALDVRMSSPFGARGRFFDAFDRHATRQAAGVWRRSNRSTWTVRTSRSKRIAEESTRLSNRWAVDWTGQAPAAQSAQPRFLVHAGINHSRERIGADRPESMSRVQVRWKLLPSPTWGHDVQVQAGYRASDEGHGWTFLAGATLQRLANNRESESGLSRFTPSWSTMLLARNSAGRGVVLYAVQPAVIGSFPVLSGSSSSLSTISQARWTLSSSTVGEAVIRLDRSFSEKRPSYSIRWMLQTRIML